MRSLPRPVFDEDFCLLQRLRIPFETAAGRGTSALMFAPSAVSQSCQNSQNSIDAIAPAS
jgi:hypothetical protein